MNYSMIEEARELVGWDPESEALSVYQVLEKLTDKRRAQGKRWSRERYFGWSRNRLTCFVSV